MIRRWVGVSRQALLNRGDFSARARGGSGTILRKRAAMSVCPQTVAASTHIEASQARKL
jgi:hypothetical protein